MKTIFANLIVGPSGGRWQPGVSRADRMALSLRDDHMERQHSGRWLTTRPVAVELFEQNASRFQRARALGPTRQVAPMMLI